MDQIDSSGTAPLLRFVVLLPALALRHSSQRAGSSGKVRSTTIHPRAPNMNAITPTTSAHALITNMVPVERASRLKRNARRFGSPGSGIKDTAHHLIGVAAQAVYSFDPFELGQDFLLPIRIIALPRLERGTHAGGGLWVQRIKRDQLICQ